MMFITASTVGYGDVTPKSTLGKFVTMTFISLMIIFVPLQTNRLVSLLSMRSQFVKNFIKEIDYLGVTTKLVVYSLLHSHRNRICRQGTYSNHSRGSTNIGYILFFPPYILIPHSLKARHAFKSLRGNRHVLICGAVDDDNNNNNLQVT